MSVATDPTSLLSIATLLSGFAATLAAFGGDAIRPGGSFWQLTRRGYFSIGFLTIALVTGVSKEIIAAQESRALLETNRELLAQAARAAQNTDNIAIAVDTPRVQLQPELTADRFILWNRGLEPLQNIQTNRGFFIVGNIGDWSSVPSSRNNDERIEAISLRGFRPGEFELPGEMLRAFERDLPDVALSLDINSLEGFANNTVSDVYQKLTHFLDGPERNNDRLVVLVELWICLETEGIDRFGGTYKSSTVLIVDAVTGKPASTKILRADSEISDPIGTCHARFSDATPAILPSPVGTGDHYLDLIARISFLAR